MKKTIILLLILSVCLALFACSGDAIKITYNDGTSHESSSAAIEKDESSESKHTLEDIFNGKDNITTKPEKEPEFVLPVFGTVEDNEYKNEYIGIGCKLGSEWRFDTEEEIKIKNGLYAELAPEEYKEKIKNSKNIYDMDALSEYGDSIVVSYTPDPYSSITGIMLDSYAEKIGEEYIKMYEAFGMTNCKYTAGKIDFGGKQRHYIDFSADDTEGDTLYQRIIYITVKGYIVSVILSSYSSESITENQLAFYSLG